MDQSLKTTGFKFLAAMALLGLTTACVKQTKFQNSGNLVTSRDEIFSTRPQNQTHFIALIKLKNPALLSSAKKHDGVTIVDQDLAEIIDQEQQAFIDEMKTLSPDIKILYRYKLVLNAVTVLAPNQYMEKIRLSPKVVFVEPTGKFAKPEVRPTSVQDPQNLKEFNSVKFIGGEALHAQGIKGQGVKVGIIDTGIDYTHSLLAGPGTEEAYKAIDPTKASASFPTQKVVGGFDFVGTAFDSASDIFEKRIPLPDQNPIDEAGHGTHVAGTVAGVMNGDKSYDGVAPEASLYALKVFGHEGSTSDEVVIAALEYAANPAGNLDLKDQLDVVNMSLGSEFGTPHILYGEAIRNLSRGGTVVVASAGNSGPRAFIVGAPGVADDAISVAASIDNAEHNWKFAAVKFLFADGKETVTEAVEGTTSKPIANAGDVEGSLVYVGLAAQDFPPDVQAQIKGKVALIDRGQVTFAEKMARAEASGAIGVVVVNNQDGAPFSMGGDGKVSIPAIMISKALGTQIKDTLRQGSEVKIRFQTPERIEKPELIDNLTDFSSQGPRSVDGFLKPEISAPGLNVISAAMGKGAQTIAMSGTSMAAPHITGVVALLKQTHKDLDSQGIKSLLMGTAVSIHDSEQKVYPVSRQGAGRVQIERAAVAPFVSIPQGISLGQVNVVGRKKMHVTFQILNLAGVEKNLTVALEEAHSALTLLPTTAPVGTQRGSFSLDFIIDGSKVSRQFEEVSGFVKFKDGNVEVLRIPVLAVAKKVAAVATERFVIESSSELDSADAVAHLSLKNASAADGLALPFNLLGEDERKSSPLVDSAYSRSCDLQAAGYRIVGDKIQIAVKLYDGLTSWNICEVNVQFDSNGDGVADQELVGVTLDKLDGLNGTEFKSLLLDAAKARDIRKEYETVLSHDGDMDSTGHKRKVDYTDAVISSMNMKYYDGSTIAVVEAPISEIKLNQQRTVGIKVATVSYEDYAVEPDDYLGNDWMKLDIGTESQGYVGLPEEIQVIGNTSSEVAFTKGSGSYQLMLLTPYNKGSVNLLEVDQQFSVPVPTYVAP